MGIPERVLRWSKRLGIAATAVAVVALGVACIVPLIPIWPFVLLEHFRVQYIAFGLVVVLGTAALRMSVYFDSAVLSTLALVIWIAPDLSREHHPVPGGGVPVRVLVLNVHTESTGYEEVRQLIDKVHADIVGLVEVDREWLTALQPSLVGYKGRLEEPRGDNFGVALYTRGGLDGSIEQLGGELPSAIAKVGFGDAHLEIILVHPIPPVSESALELQLTTLEGIADRARSTAGPVVVMGDFNATPWSTPFQRLLARSGLCDSRAGFGVQATFPATSRLLRIPIDHLLASCSIGVADRRVERDVGSDHLPVVVDLVLPR